MVVDKKSNMQKNQITLIYLLTVIIAWSSVLSLVTSPISLNLNSDVSLMVYAQGNNTNDSLLQDRPLATDDDQSNQAEEDSGSNENENSKDGEENNQEKGIRTNKVNQNEAPYNASESSESSRTASPENGNCRADVTFTCIPCDHGLPIGKCISTEDWKTETKIEIPESKTDKEDKPIFESDNSDQKQEDVCGINPNATPCCTPGEDKNCTDINVNQTEGIQELDLSKIVISEFTTNPNPLKYGEEFEIQVKIENNLDVPIGFIGNYCGFSPLSADYDSYVSIYTEKLPCSTPYETILDGHESTIVKGADNAKLRALSVGESTVTIRFFFHTIGENSVRGVATETFTFNIQNSDNPMNDPSIEGIPQSQSSNNPPVQGIPQTQSTGNQDVEYTGEVTISDFKTTPSTIFPGIPFTYEVKVTNKMNAPIFFYNSCSKTSLGYNIENGFVGQHPRLFCDDLTVNKVKLESGASTKAYGPGQRNAFVYSTLGEKEIDINLYYNLGNLQGFEDHTEWIPFKVIVGPTNAPLSETNINSR